MIWNPNEDDVDFVEQKKMAAFFMSVWLLIRIKVSVTPYLINFELVQKEIQQFEQKSIIREVVKRMPINQINLQIYFKETY